MNILPYTFLLLTLTAILVAVRFHQSLDDALIHQSLMRQSELSRARTNAEEHRLYTLWCEINLKPGPKKGHERTEEEKKEGTPKPPPPPEDTKEEICYEGSSAKDFLLTSRLNLAAQNELIRSLFSRLIQQVYEPALDTNLAPLLERLEEALDDSPELASIDLEDGQLQRLWCNILKGRKDHYPPLLQLVKWEPNSSRQMEIFRLDRRLILALTENEQLTDRIIDARTELLNQYAQSKEKVRFEEELEAFIQGELASHPALATQFDELISYKIRPPENALLLTVSPEAGRAIKVQSNRNG